MPTIASYYPAAYGYGSSQAISSGGVPPPLLRHLDKHARYELAEAAACDRSGSGGVVGPYPASSATAAAPGPSAWADSSGSSSGIVELSGASLVRSGAGADAPWLVLAKAAAMSGQDQQPRGKTVTSKVWNAATGAVDVTADPTRAQKRKHQINSVAQNALARQMELSSQAALNSVGLGGAGNTGRLHKPTARSKYGW